MKNTIINPYADVLPGKHPGCLRLNTNVLKSDVDRIRIVSLKPGFLTHAMCMFVKHLATTCDQNKWDLSHEEQLNQYVNNLLNRPIVTNAIVPAGPARPKRYRAGAVGSTPAVNPHKHAAVSGDETEKENGDIKAA